MKIAIVGSGIAGLSAAYYLNKAMVGRQQQFDITVFEDSDRIGGHTATIDVDYRGQHYAIDTGFIVFNDWTYPNFIRLLDEIGVASQPTDMSFAVSCRNTGLEYAGTNFNTLFAQRRNLVRPAFLRMLLDIVRFNRQSVADLAAGRIPVDMTLGEYLERERYDGLFVTHYLIPMGAAIWSAGTTTMLEFPLQFFVRFCSNHGLLSVSNRPQWRTIVGGSKAYLKPLTRDFAHRIRTGCGVRSIDRHADGVHVVTQKNERLNFDGVVLACHSDQALRLLADASVDERAVLGALPYEENDVVLHSDTHLLPKSRLAWSSWNYALHDTRQAQATVTYNMNILQRLLAPQTFCVTLNDTANIDPRKVIGRFRYSHPVFSLPGIAAQSRWADISGVNRTWFCGAYWHNGFHEDGVVSALNVAQSLKQHAQGRKAHGHLQETAA
jgi:predicted NAD/FAD-binding protein